MAISIKRASTTHVALLYLKMKNTWVTENDLYNLAPAKYKSRSKAKDSLDRLVKLNYANYNGSHYMINASGLSAMYLIVKEQPRSAGYAD